MNEGSLVGVHVVTVIGVLNTDLDRPIGPNYFHDSMEDLWLCVRYPQIVRVD